jgi:hypothetical protein
MIADDVIEKSESADGETLDPGGGTQGGILPDFVFQSPGNVNTHTIIAQVFISQSNNYRCVIQSHALLFV